MTSWSVFLLETIHFYQTVRCHLYYFYVFWVSLLGIVIALMLLIWAKQRNPEDAANSPWIILLDQVCRAHGNQQDAFYRFPYRASNLLKQNPVHQQRVAMAFIRWVFFMLHSVGSGQGAVIQLRQAVNIVALRSRYWVASAFFIHDHHRLRWFLLKSRVCIVIAFKIMSFDEVITGELFNEATLLYWCSVQSLGPPTWRKARELFPVHCL